MIAQKIITRIEDKLSQDNSASIKITGTQMVYGGSINLTYKLISNKGDYFIKINSKSRFPDMFQKELEGLEQLERHFPLKVPQVLCHGTEGDSEFLLMEFVHSSDPSEKFWENFGRALAEMHQKSSSKKFGYTSDNYIGSLVQKNDWTGSWASFFIKSRIDAQTRLAFDQCLIDSSLLAEIDHFNRKVESLFPEEEPALLHGDLWSGNFMVAANGEAAIFDPAIYFGNREMDIAMTHLFGGFHSTFYSSYLEYYPLQKGWEERIDLCNLYPLLVHVNLFGASYLPRVKAILKRYL